LSSPTYQSWVSRDMSMPVLDLSSLRDIYPCYSLSQSCTSKPPDRSIRLIHLLLYPPPEHFFLFSIFPPEGTWIRLIRCIASTTVQLYGVPKNTSRLGVVSLFTLQHNIEHGVREDMDHENNTRVTIALPLPAGRDRNNQAQQILRVLKAGLSQQESASLACQPRRPAQLAVDRRRNTPRPRMASSFCLLLMCQTRFRLKNLLHTHTPPKKKFSRTRDNSSEGERW
jgi:hypothetical protein